MDESAALAVIAVRAVEQGDGTRTLWSDADRTWASRAAAQVVGETADSAAFVACRARLALDRLAQDLPDFVRVVRALRWRPWICGLLVAAAFLAGLVVDRIGGGQRINLLAPPVFALIVWNLAVYVALAVGYVLRYGDAGTPGPLRRALLRLVARKPPRGIGTGEGALARSVTLLVTDWLRSSGPLYAIRITRILHLAAAALALGVIAGLYLRGLAFEFRASWESTFLDANTVRALLAALLSAGSFVARIPVPDVAAIEAIRAPASVNAAPWLHLLAATVASVVVVPRLLLATIAWWLESFRAARLPVTLTEPYFLRLLRGFRGGPLRVRVIPYSYTLPAGVLAGLEAVIQHSFGGSAALTVEAPVTYGEEDRIAGRELPVGDASVIALFNLTATPEREAHGSFIAALAAHTRPEAPLLVVVDTSAFRARWPHDDARCAQRQGLWSEVLRALNCTPVFVDLEAPDFAQVEAAVELAFAARATRATTTSGDA